MADTKTPKPDPKRVALTQILDALATIEKSNERVEVLRAAAAFNGIALPMELPR
jgi:hypothetical protein